jgi:stage V sporulation protein B
VRIDKFYKDSFILTLSNLVTGVIGFLFSIILSRKLGPEGLGLYGLIMPIYGLLLCITCEGLITSVSRISAVCFSKKDFRNVNRTVTTVLGLVLLWSFGVALLTFLNSEGIAGFFIKDQRASEAIRILCPALVFVPLSAVIKGYFYGLGKFRITASADIVEKLLRVLVLLGVIATLSLKDMKSLVSAAYLALTVGELTSLAILYFFQKSYRNRFKGGISKSKSRIQLMFDVFVIACPLYINGILSSILSAASTLILPRRLVQAGFAYKDALSLIGKFTGMAYNITFLPFIIVGSMMTVLVPDLSTSAGKKDTWAVESRIAQVLKVSCMVGMASLVISLTIPDILGELFYGRKDLGRMISFAAITGFFSYLSAPTFGILNGLGKQNILLRNSLILSVESVLAIFIFTGIPAINIYGCGIASFITAVTALVLNLAEIGKICEISLRPSDFLTLALTGVLVFAFLKLENQLLFFTAPALKALLIVISGFGLIFVLTRMVSKANKM